MPRPRVRRLGVGLGALLLLGLLPTSADAAPDWETTQFFQTFRWSSAGVVHPVRRPPTATGQTNVACLTANTSKVRTLLPACPTVVDGNGTGALRLTSAKPNQVGAVFAADSNPFTKGLDATFTTYQYGTSDKPGNGISFDVAASDPGLDSPTVQVGPGSGSLGYAATASTPGLSKGYLGVGLDVAGTAGTTAFQGTRCGHRPAFADPVPAQVVVRGPGDGTRGYCLEDSTAFHHRTTIDLRGPENSPHPGWVVRHGLAVRVEVAVNPSDDTARTASGWTVEPDSYLVVVEPRSGPREVLHGWLPHVPSNLYPHGWTDEQGYPRQVVIGVSASTGTSTDVHEVTDLKVADLGPTRTSRGRTR